MKSLRALHIEDSERDHALFRRHLLANGIELIAERVDTVTAMEHALSRSEWDVIICDYSMPHFSAPEALENLRRLGVDIPFIIISGTVGEEEAVRALKAGANDYLMKDNLARLVPAIAREMQDAENRRARRLAEEEQKRLDLELNRERERLRNIVGTVPGVVWEVWGDTSGSSLAIDFVSDYVEAMLGYTVQEWLAKPGFWLSIIHDDDRDRIKRIADRKYQSGEDWRMEFRWIAKDGRIVWVESQIVVLKDRDGQPVGLRGVNLDITERKHAEITISESEARFRSLFSAIPKSIWVYDLETLRILRVNDAAIEQYGYTRDELLSMTIKDIRPAEQVPELLERIRNEATGSQGVWQHRTKDGKLIDVEVISHALQYEGRACKIVSMSDVTERKLAEQQLIKSEERYRDLVENAHDIIYSHDLQGNYTSINEAGERITGYSRQETLRMNVSDTVAPEFLDLARGMIAAKLRGEESTAYEIELLAKDGRRICLEVNTKLTLQDGEPVGIQGIARDVSSRKHLEEQLMQAQKLESVGRLAGGIAHDFNNMLTAINGYSDLTLRQLPEEHKVRHNIEEIKKAGERSAQLTNQLLAFSRRQLLQPEVVVLNEVLADTTEILRRVIGEDIQLVTNLPAGVGSVKVDRGQLSQIIMNLSVNARDAMPDGGELSIGTENIFFDSEYAKAHPGVMPGAYVKLSVSDNGTGIDYADLQHIFEPFFTTKKVGKGTGLGLATVYGIVKQSGGHISVASVIGSGTTFDIVLPRVVESPGVASVPRKEVVPLAVGPETILLVEDEEMVRALLKETLEACRYKVIEASDGVAALAIGESLSEPIHLLITDVVMPHMGGRELAERLGKLMPDMPVLFVSGYTDDTYVRESVLEAGVNFIQKPFTLESISLRVREILDSQARRNS